MIITTALLITIIRRRQTTQINNKRGTAVAQWLRFCATNLKVAVSIPDGVIGLFR
jgi:hypothetical protein